LSDSRTKKAAAEAESRAFKQKIENLIAERNQAIVDGVREQTSALVKKWLAPALRVETTLASGAGSARDALTRAEAALQQQACHDRHSGNRRQLQERYDELKRMETRLQTAAQEAIAPLKSVRDALAEVRAELKSVQTSLGSTPTQSDLLHRLLLQISQASTWDQAAHLGDLARTLSDESLLDSTEQRKLYDHLHRKLSLFHEPELGSPITCQESGWSLRSAVLRNTDCLLLLDGHNVLFLLRDIFGRHVQDKYPDDKSRKNLEQALHRFIATRSNVKATLWYDGPKHTIYAPTGNITVAFSGGDGPQRADRRIREQLRDNAAAQPRRKAFLVTDDRELRKEAASLGAISVPVNLFAVLLADFGCLD
jgi:hypothetical protein